MADERVVLLVEAHVLPEHRAEVLKAAAASVIPARKEEGVEVFYEASREDDPNRIVFFEVFRSQAGHDFHMQQEYTKKLFEAIDGKLAENLSIRRLTLLS
jgi:quinol monooxygenase YgiN